MDEIKDLIKIITDHTKKNLPLLDLKSQQENGNKEMNLFLGIKNGEFKDDVDASHGIYGSEEVDFKFRMLKSRLNRKLLNHLFFMDFTSKNFSKSVNHYQEALDYLHFSRMLLSINEIRLGTKMLYKTYDLAKECEFTVIAIDCLRELRKVYAKIYRPKLFQNIKVQLNELERIERLEEQADEIFQENRLAINSTVNNRKKSFEPYKKAIAALGKLLHKTNSYNVFEKHFKLKIWYFELTGEFQHVLKLIYEAESDYQKGRINQKRFDHLFANVSKANALIKLRKFKEGSIFLEQMLNEVDNTSMAWYSFAEKYVMLHIQNSQFDKASEIFMRVAGNKSFSDLEEKEILKWNIFRSYLFYITEDKKIIRKFNYRKFIEQIPEFSKEHAGYNVAILILQIMILATGDLSILHTKLSALDDYLNKYLNNSYSKRTKTFGKLLHKIAIHNRDYNAIIVKSRYLQEKLLDSEVAGDSFIDFEVVPYEFLWEHLLKKIKTSKINFM